MIESSLMVSASIDFSARCILITYDNGRVYTVDSDFVKDKMCVNDLGLITKIEIGMNGSELVLYTKTDNVKFPWDFILCYFEPEYKYFSGVEVSAR